MRREAKRRGTLRTGAKTVQQRVDYRKAVLVGQTSNISFLKCGSLEALFGDHARPQATSDLSSSAAPDTAAGPGKAYHLRNGVPGKKRGVVRLHEWTVKVIG